MMEFDLAGAGFDIQSILPKLQQKTPEELKAIGQRMDADGVPLPSIPGFDSGDQSALNVPGLQNAPTALPPAQELPGLQGALSPTFEGNTGEVAADTAAGDAAAPKSNWEQFLGDPQLMLNLGAQLLAPRTGGVSDLGHAASGIAGAANRLAAKKKERTALGAAGVEAKSKQDLRAAQTTTATAQGVTAGARADRADEIIDADIRAKNRSGKTTKPPTEQDKLVSSIVASSKLQPENVRALLKQGDVLQKSITAEGKNFPLSRAAREEQGKRLKDQQGQLDKILDQLYPPEAATQKTVQDFTDDELRTLGAGQANAGALPGFVAKYGQEAITRLRALGIEAR